MNQALSPTIGARDLENTIDEGILVYELAEDPPNFLTENGAQMTSEHFKNYVRCLDTDYLRTAYNHP